MPRKSATATRSPQPSGRRGVGLPMYGIILLIAGVLLLLQTTGILSWDLWINLWRFWPLLVIAMGIYILFGRKIGWWATVLVIVAILVAVGGALVLGSGKEPPVSNVAEPLTGIQSVDVSIVFGAGDMTLRSLDASSPNLVEGRFGEPGKGAKVQLVRTGNTGKLQITMDRRPWTQWFSTTSWEIALSQIPTLSITLQSGAANVKLDLRELRATKLGMDVGAADVEITLPAKAGNVSAEIKAGAANITLIVPEGVAAKVKKRTGVSSFSIDGGRFPLSGDEYVSPGFDAAKNRVTIDLQVGASNITIK